MGSAWHARNRTTPPKRKGCPLAYASSSRRPQSKSGGTRRAGRRTSGVGEPIPWPDPKRRRARHHTSGSVKSCRRDLPAQSRDRDSGRRMGGMAVRQLASRSATAQIVCRVEADRVRVIPRADLTTCRWRRTALARDPEDREHSCDCCDHDHHRRVHEPQYQRPRAKPPKASRPTSATITPTIALQKIAIHDPRNDDRAAERQTSQSSLAPHYEA